MSQTPDRASESGSDCSWPIDLNLEQIHQEQVLFENIAEEYVKGDDITIFFTIVNDGQINPDADRIGLARVKIFVLYFDQCHSDRIFIFSFRLAVQIRNNAYSMLQYKSHHRLVLVLFVMVQQHLLQQHYPMSKMNSINFVISIGTTNV